LELLERALRGEATAEELDTLRELLGGPSDYTPMSQI
jgi:hypothetical protein